MVGELLEGSSAASADSGLATTGALELRLRNTWLGLEFRSLTRSGVRSSVFTLVSSALGAGCLSLPYAVRVSGLGLCMVVMLCAAVLTILSGSVLVRHAAEVRGRRSDQFVPGPVPSWGPLLEELLGPVGGVLMDIVIFLLAGGVLVLYYSFTGDFLESLRDLLHVSKTTVPRWILIYASLAVTVPLGFPKDIGALQGTSIFIVGVLVVVALLATAGVMSCHPLPEEPLAWLPASWSGLLQAFCTFIFTLMFHLNIFTVYDGLREPHAWSPRSREPRGLADKERMQNIVLFAAVVCVLLNLWIAVAGYLPFRQRTLQDFVLVYTTEPGCAGWVVIVAHITQALLALCTICGVPINVVPARQALASLAARASGRGDGQSLLQVAHRRYLITLVMCTGMAALAATTSSVATIIGFLGGALSTLVMFLLPALFYAGGKLDVDRPWLRLLTLGALLLGTAAGFANVGVLIAKAF